MAQKLAFTAFAALIPLITAQQIGTDTPEVNLPLPTWKCTTSGGCVQQNTSIVLDWNFHWIHQVNSSASCATSTGAINSTLCPDEATCAKNCAIEGIPNYASSGVATSGDALTLHQYTQSNGVTSNASPRVYLLGADGNYEMLQLLGQELRFDADVSTLVCGENGALYLSEMDATGGRSQYNPGGASYGSGYCDAQCPVQTWINGTLNTNSQGACCNEMDIWEANANATALTPHPCEGDTCDKSGCGFNPYAQGVHSYYGNGGTVDTLKPVTVITQFYTSDNTTTGSLSEIRRLYMQDGKLIQNAVSTSTAGLDSITASWCTSSDASAASLGGLTTMGQALGRGMVLIFSIWNDGGQFMNWLDSGSNGPCSSTAGNPASIEAQTPGTYATFSNIRWGDIGSTFEESGASSPSSTAMSTSTSTTTVAKSPAQSQYGQCGGNGWAGPTACAAPHTCTLLNPYYSQCL
ncbi:putative endoglucanase [Mollisia scopiformis]|uniref:Glucanase n=1 Tax=Mollisia scopiformis TaxID=149040 RepID=A0A194XF60_MOLSC|nr:putative endoglucanase [Mollisia scopiformis]KUJ18830.1 putative endoglucanase [Mollisia scopiformis]